MLGSKAGAAETSGVKTAGEGSGESLEERACVEGHSPPSRLGRGCDRVIVRPRGHHWSKR